MGHRQSQICRDRNIARDDRAGRIVSQCGTLVTEVMGSFLKLHTILRCLLSGVN